MEIRELKLLNFRNYSNTNISFEKKINIIYGNNGTGKTNLVEAIYLLALTKSFRKVNDKNLIQLGKQICKIEGNIIQNNKNNNYKVLIKDDGKIVKINNFKENKISNYISKIIVVFFGPDDLKIIKETPLIRRKMLNIELSLLDEKYLRIITIYNKILKQRNAYLKKMVMNKITDQEYLDILTEKLIMYGIKTYEIRKNFIHNINNYIKDIYCNITNNNTLLVKYESNYDNLDYNQIFKLYKDNLKKELILGTTIFGIHKDDLLFYIDNEEMINYASEGQIKNAIIAFKLAQIEYIYELRKDYPIVVFDDLFSELDKEKVNNIISLLKEDIEIFITTTDVNLLRNDIKKKSNLIDINEIKKEGKIDGE